MPSRRDTRELRSGKNSRRHDATGKIRRSQRALDRDRHDRGRGLGCGCQDRGKTAPPRAGRALQRRQVRHQGVLLRRRRLVCPGQTVKDLQDEMRRHLDQGYTMVKMKVGGLPLAEDVRRIEAVKKILPADAQLAVDANSKFGREEALAYANALAPFRLRWFEEPCDPLDFALLAEIAADYDSPLATGENLFSTQDVENLVRFGGLRPDR